MELEPSRIEFAKPVDRRKMIPEPLPVRLVAIEDVTLLATAGLERDLDDFYGKLLGFARDATDSHRLTYRADNLRLNFNTTEKLIDREEYRPLQVQVPLLRDLEMKLIEAELQYERHRGLTAGSDLIVLRDPAGNWLEIMSWAEVR